MFVSYKSNLYTESIIVYRSLYITTIFFLIFMQSQNTKIYIFIYSKQRNEDSLSLIRNEASTKNILIWKRTLFRQNETFQLHGSPCLLQFLSACCFLSTDKDFSEVHINVILFSMFVCSFLKPLHHLLKQEFSFLYFLYL